MEIDGCEGYIRIIGGGCGVGWEISCLKEIKQDKMYANRV
jgi:hypothetical protein